MRRTLSIVLASVASLSSLPRSGAQSRSIAPGAWHQEARMDGEHGIAFTWPELLALSGNSILVYDADRQTIVSFDRSGRMQWESGRTPAGVARLETPMELAGDGQGGALVVDRRGTRITTVDAKGLFTNRLYVELPVRSAAYMPDRRVVVAPSFTSLAAFIDAQGYFEHAVPLPGDKGKLVVSEQVAHPDDNGNVLVTFGYSSKAMILDARLRTRRSFSLIDSQPFPVAEKFKPFLGKNVTAVRVDPKAVQVVRSASLTHDTLYVLDGRTVATQPVLDLYSARTGTYVESRILPEAFSVVRVDGDVLVGITERPMPSVSVWRWERRAP